MILHSETIEHFNTDPTLLKEKSDKWCVVKCDICNSVFNRKYGKIIRGRINISIDACDNKECQTTKRKQVFLKLYGTEHPTQNKEIQEKRKKTFIEKYGVENPFQNAEIKEKIKQSTLKKYGVENVAFSQEIKEKRKQANLEKYGTEYPYQNSNILLKVKQKLQSNHNVDSYGHLQRIRYNIIEQYCQNKNYIPLFSEQDYSHRKQHLTFKCIEHDIEFSSTLENISRDNVEQCPKCKHFKSTSGAEREVLALIQETKIPCYSSCSNIISPYELDVYIPQFKLAIEYNGLYWHSEIFKDKNYHFNKFKLCEGKQIQCLQIYDDEWRDKQEICKSIIKNKLNLCQNKLNARDMFTEGVQPSSKEQVNEIHKFTDLNHLQGSTKFSKAFVLRDNKKEIVFCITLRKPFTSSYKNSIEIARVCSKLNTVVRGGFSKIMKNVIEWSKQNNYSSILTYSDCRYSFGNTYRNYGFDFIGHTGMGYDYTNFTNRFGRFKFRAKNEKSELEVAEENKVYKIHNAGNYIWKMNI